ncbi:integrase [Thermococcus sp. 18S1]|uniref:integrase n=1 Tax=Thermococcus sp. 18S1 TaxID=1638210 RepID=UPI00143967F5|nr:integrase [Thermococcus sp. 18S1]
MNPGQRRGRHRKSEFFGNEGGIWEYAGVKGEFGEWLHKRKGLADRTRREYVRRLEKFFNKYKIRTLHDLEAALEAEGNPRNLAKALRNYIAFLLEKGVIDEAYYNELKKRIVIRSTGTDLYVPDDAEVRGWYEKRGEWEEPYQLVFELILFSGIRVSEALKVLSEFEPSRLHINDQYAYYDLGWSRGSKKSWVVFMPPELANRLKRLTVTDDGVYSYFSKRKIHLKYLRKWFINKALEAGAPVNVVKFLAGHSLSGDITSLHYIDMLGQARRYYPDILYNIRTATKSL